jgi:SAM-dependent methyltransferase
MDTPTPRFWEIFFEVYEALPRQGPGNRECAARALSLCSELPPAPSVLDLGCGVGGQTFQVAELTGGTIVAVDTHAPWMPLLTRAARERGLARRVRALRSDMASLPLSPGSFDLVWSEGALYNVGVEVGLRICRGLLRPGGYLAFSDAVWRRADPPAEVREGFDQDYPTMGWTADTVAAIERCEGLELHGHFTLPDEAWWDDFYTPMTARVQELRGRHAGDAEALAALDLIGREPELHRDHSDCYAYELFVARRSGRRIIGLSGARR